MHSEVIIQAPALRLRPRSPPNDLQNRIAAEKPGPRRPAPRRAWPGLPPTPSEKLIQLQRLEWDNGHWSRFWGGRRESALLAREGAPVANTAAQGQAEPEDLLAGVFLTWNQNGRLTHAVPLTFSCEE